jgi:hypothetical protein
MLESAEHAIVSPIQAHFKHAVLSGLSEFLSELCG